MVKKIAVWGGIAFLLFFIAYRPESAMDVLSALGNTVKDVGQAIADLVDRMIA